MVRWMGGEILRVFGELGVPKCRSRADLQYPGPDFLKYPSPDRKISKNLVGPDFPGSLTISQFLFTFSRGSIVVGSGKNLSATVP